MKNVLMSIVLLFSAFLISANDPQPTTSFEIPALCEENPQPDCYCILIWDPVCGCNNVTYGNSCEAMCAGITDFKKGECKDKKPKKDRDP